MLHKKGLYRTAGLLLAVVLCFNSLGAGAAEKQNPFTSLGSNRFEQPTDNTVVKNSYTLDGYNLVAENENLGLYIREEICSVRVLNKKSGYVWGSFSVDEPEDMNENWSAFGNSVVSIEYYDESTSLKRTGCSAFDAESEFRYEDNAVYCDVSFTDIEISLTVKIELCDDHIRYSVDDKTVKEKGDYFIGSLYFSPFLGSVSGDSISGYMLVPDGSGALMRFQKPAEYLSGYNARVYGMDYAIDNLYEANNLSANHPNDFLKDIEVASMPVYGLVHGVKQNALFGHIESGAEYAAISATPAGFVTDYNWISAGFIYHQSYMQPIKKSGAGIQVVQKKKNTVNPALSVYFLNGEDADYMGMAKKYKDILNEQGLLPEKGKADGADIALDFIMSDIKKGFFFSTKKTVTSYKYLEKVINKLDENGIEDYRLSLLGWQKGGLNGYSKNKAYKKTAFGSFAKVADLKSMMGKSGEISLYMDAFSAKEPQFNEKKDIGITLSQSVINRKSDDEKKFLGDTYYIKLPKALDMIKKQTKILVKKDMGTPVLDNSGVLYGEYLTDNFVSRTKAKDLTAKTFADVSKEGKVVAFKPNEYLFPYVSEYRNAPMSSSQYSFESDSVPFLQTVLSGYVKLYAPYTNENFYLRENILKSIEYNCYPSFLLTELKNSKLKKTVIAEKSSTAFSDWEDRITDIYNEIVPILSKVEGLEVQNRKILKEGVTLVTYENGGSICVNYTAEDYALKGTNVKAQSAAYIEGSEI